MQVLENGATGSNHLISYGKKKLVIFSLYAVLLFPHISWSKTLGYFIIKTGG